MGTAELSWRVDPGGILARLTAAWRGEQVKESREWRLERPPAHRTTHDAGPWTIDRVQGRVMCAAFRSLGQNELDISDARW
jgi:hypothetical protein